MSDKMKTSVKKDHRFGVSRDFAFSTFDFRFSTFVFPNLAKEVSYGQKKESKSHRCSSLFGVFTRCFLRVGRAGGLPNRPIEVVVHSSPGGITDTVGRLVSAKMSELFGVSIMITNKAAGSGAQGIEAVVKAKPDGYTILAGADTALTLIPLMNPEVPFRYTNLAPISWSAYGPNVILVKSDSPFKTLQDLLAFAKKNPGKLNHGSSGVGHMTNISFQIVKRQPAVNIVHVPYQGGGPLRSAILGGQVDVTCDTIVGVPALVKTGAVRALAICADQRSKELPRSQPSLNSDLQMPPSGLVRISSSPGHTAIHHRQMEYDGQESPDGIPG